MRASLLLSALCATAWAAPTFPKITADAAIPENLQAISEYFNILAAQVQDSRGHSTPPVCDLSQISLPAGAATLPPPAPGLVLKHIAIGRGTQNYTCASGNPLDAPKAAGAVATLFNASCIVATSPHLASVLGRAALQFPLAQSEATSKLSPSSLGISGVHFFTDATTAFFNLDVSEGWKLGEIPCGKNGSVPAPVDAPKGLKGEGAVPWLKLNAKKGATGGLQEVYRVETVGGSAPKTCEGLPGSFEVQYSTQYWFYAA